MQRTEIHVFCTMTGHAKKYKIFKVRISNNEEINHLISIFFNHYENLQSNYHLSPIIYEKQKYTSFSKYMKQIKITKLLIKVNLFIDVKKKKFSSMRNYNKVEAWTAMLLKVWSSLLSQWRQRRKGSSFEKLADDIHWTILPSLR